MITTASATGCMVWLQEVAAQGSPLNLRTEQSAFAKFGARIGQQALCTVLRKANDNWRVLVTVDSLIGNESMAA